MKQKRKRKSLIRKSINWNYGLLTNILLIAGFLFYFGAVSLLTIGVIAAGGDGSYVGYTGYDDKGEVIYNMLFVNQEDQSDDGIVNKMYVGSDPSTASNLYIVPNSFIVQRFGNYGGMFFSNKVGADVYANILGGDNIEIFSDDITVLGGYDNVIYKGNDNSVLLGGDSNKILTGNDGGVSAVLLGGMENSIGNGQNGNVIIGGYRNEIMDTVSDSNIIGGENNKVSGDGVIVAGSNVNVDSDVDNVFVFSDNSDNTVFSPKSSNAFYLNVESGLGINKGIDGGTESAGVQSSGAVSVGEININSSVCNTLDVTNNIGVQGSWNGCMVGCTAGSASVGKWDLLDQSKYCKDLCKRNPSKCVDPVEPVPSNYSGYCSDSQPAYSVLCDGLNPSKWINTVFEVKLVDNGSCPGSSNINQCVYQCKTHYHLFDGTCKADCKLPWSSEYVKHNTVIQPYSATRVQCGPQGCNNRRTTLRCDDGKWVGGSATTYKYEHCTTEGYYSCQSDGYTFTSSTLANGKCTASCTNYNVKNNSCEAAGRYWKCSCNTGFVLNSAKTACVEEDAGDLCGSDNGKTLTNAPTALCNGDGVEASNPVKDETNGVWNWTCTKEGKEPQSCHANIKTIPNPDPINYKCIGETPANADLIEGSNEDLTSDVNNTVYESVSAAGNNKCAYICKSSYTYVENQGVPQCVQCVAGTYDAATKTCQIQLGCNGGGYVYGPSPSTPGGYACLRLGYCSYNGSYPESVPDPNGESIAFQLAQPVGVDDMAWKCVEGTPSNYQCQYKCKQGYSCVDGKCVGCPEKTFYNLYGFTSTMAKYYSTDVITKIVGGGGGALWKHVDNLEVQTEKGCYYTCDSSKSYWDDPWGYGCVKKACDDLPQGVDSNSVDVIKQPGNSYRWSWTYKTNADFNSVSSSDVGCFYTCKEGFHEVERNRTRVCIPDDTATIGCPEITFYNLYGFTSTMAKYYTTNVLTGIVDGGDGLWNHVDDLDAQTEKGCYYTCDPSISYWGNPWGYGCVKKACDDLPQGVESDSVDVIRHPGNSYRWPWTYKTNADFNAVRSSDVGCFYTCKEGFHEEERNGIKVCIPDDTATTGCPEITFYNLYGYNSTMAKYYTTNVLTGIVDGGNGLWSHVDDLDAQTEKGCYYTCDPSISYWGNPWGYGCVKKACDDLPQLVESDSVDVIRHPGNSYRWSWTYKTNADFNSVSSSDVGCFYTCKTGFHEEDREGTKICVWDGPGGDNGDPDNPDNPVCNADEGFELVDGECLSKCRPPYCTDCGWNKTVKGCTQNEITNDVSELDCAAYGNDWHLVSGEGSAMCVLCVSGTWNSEQKKCI